MSWRRLTVLAIGACCSLVPPAAVAQPADPLEGKAVSAIRVMGLTHLSSGDIERHLATRVGEPFHHVNLAIDKRRLDELRLFSSVVLEPRLDAGGVVLDVTLAETLRLLPIVVVKVTDENGVSAGAGMRTLNLFGGGAQSSVSATFGGETSVSAFVDSTTITPGTWAQRFSFKYSVRPNPLYDFDEESLEADARISRNWPDGVRAGGIASLLSIDTGEAGPSISPNGRDIIPTAGAFVSIDTLDSSTNPRRGTYAEVEIDRLFVDANSWRLILDGRRYQPLAERHGLAVNALATFQSGEVDVDLPEYLQYALGGSNTVRGWDLGSQIGRNQFLGTLEYTYVLRPVQPFSVAGVNLYAGVQAAGFTDMGVAWDHSFTGAPVIGGGGVGLRLLVPFVDVIRLDVAWGQPDGGASTYFGISLKAVRQRDRVR